MIAGAGITGLSASFTSGAPALETEREPGGVCRSFELQGARGCWKFDFGGGHWVFGGDAMLNRFLARFADWKKYRRRSSIFLEELGTLVPFPIQNHLYALPQTLRTDIWREMKNAPAGKPAILAEWLEASFGPTLYRLFFGPFHELYTACLSAHIAADDLFKTPLDLARVERGLQAPADSAGYNATFLYPAGGLGAFVGRLAAQARAECGNRVTSVDAGRRVLMAADGSSRPYSALLSTLPLDLTLELCGLPVQERPDPYTSVLVLNIGATPGPRCPNDHWVYIPRSRSGFHRVGFYSNVDRWFVPGQNPSLASLYVERALPPGTCMDPGEYQASVLAELQQLGWIEEVDVVQASHVEVAYTWRRPGSCWRERAMEALAGCGVFAAGRYGRWRFQGIAESLREGLLAGALLGDGR